MRPHREETQDSSRLLRDQTDYYSRFTDDLPTEPHQSPQFTPPNIDGTHIRLPTDIANSSDIDARFGTSTRHVIGERYDNGRYLDEVGYQTDGRSRVGPPPRGIFDDV